MDSGLFRIRGAVQPYDWGGYSYIRALLGESGTPDNPSAEYWLGTHPNAPSKAVFPIGEQDLSVVLENMGQPPLSFLMKILDVRMMLSIQVHPSIPQAEEGYAREDAKEIPLKAGKRTYKDKNHKPELMFALSKFWMLHGLRSEAELEIEFKNRPSCTSLLAILSNKGLRGLVSAVLEPNNPVIETVLNNLLEEIELSEESFGKLSPEFWIQRWLEDNPGVFTGILMIFLMNIIELQPGEAVYQPDRLLHAYLEGQNVEIMANSDNVLRAGLTSKHIDAEELLKITNFEPTDPSKFKVNVDRDENGIRSFNTPFKDFLLKEIEVPPNSERKMKSERSQILLFITGEQLGISTENTDLNLIPGEACFSRTGNEIFFSNPTNRTAKVFIGS